MKKISIIIPFFDGNDYIVEAIESIKMQSYKNIELILVNNDVSKGSQKLLNAIVKQDQRFFLIEESNIGIANALNAGIKKAVGEIIVFLDQDDIFHKDRISHMVTEMDKSDLDFIACRGTIIDSNGQKIKDNDKYNSPSSLYPIIQMQISIVSSLSYFTIKKNVLKKHLPLSEKYGHMIDYYLMMKLIQNKNKIYLSNALLVKKRHHESNTSLDMYISAQQTIPALIDFYENCTEVNRFYSKANVKNIITERYLGGVQYLRRRNRFNEIIGFQKEYVQMGYIRKEIYMYFSGMSILKVDKNQFPFFIEENKLDHPFYNFLMGLFHFKLENYKDATYYFKKAVNEHDLVFIEAINSLALSQYFQNKDVAIDTLKKLINFYPKYKDSFLNYSYIKNDEKRKFKHSDISKNTFNNFMYFFDTTLLYNKNYKI